MRTYSLLVAAIACLSSLAAAEPDRPRFYFPRQVKRQVWNNLTGPLTTPARSPSLSLPRQDSSTTKRQSDPLSGSGGIFPSDGATGTGTAPSTTDSVMTVVIESTTVVIDSGQPATTTPTTPNTPDTLGAATTTSDAAIIFGPSGVITPSTAAPTNANPIVTVSTVTDSAATTTPNSAPSSTAAVIDSILSSVVSVVSSDLASIIPAPTTSSAPVDSAAPTTTDGITGPGTSVAPTVAPTSTQDVLSSIISDVSAAVTTNIASSAPTATDLGILSSIASVLDSATDSITLPIVTATPTLPIVTTTPTLPTDTLAPTLPTDTLAPTLPTDTLTPTLPTVTLAPTQPTDTTPPPPPTDTSGISFTAVPTGGASSTDSIITSASGSAPSPTASIDGPITVSDNNTSIIPPTSVGSQAVITDSGATATPTVSTGEILTTGGAGNITDSPTATQPAASASATDTAPVTSILPIGSDAASTAWLPATIVVQSSPIASDAIATTATGIATTLPQAISPPTGIPQVPQDSTLIQVGFNYSLNYAFVVANPNSSAQIFMYLPKGLAFGLSIKEELVTMHSLNPYDTQNTLGFITTLATAWIPSNMVDTLKQSLHQQLSDLYQDPDLSVFQLMQYINPTIPLIPGGPMVDGSAAATGTGASTSATANAGGNGVFNTDSQNSSSTTKSTTAVIAVTAIGAAAAYGAAMFFIARRYKKRKSLHRRTSSVMSPSQMRFAGSPALMGGALMSGGRGTPGLQNGRESRGSGRSAGNSARTVEISAPMMAENSLGWN